MFLFPILIQATFPLLILEVLNHRHLQAFPPIQEYPIVPSIELIFLLIPVLMALFQALTLLMTFRPTHRPSHLLVRSPHLLANHP